MPSQGSTSMITECWFWSGPFKGTSGLEEGGRGGMKERESITRVAENKHLYNRAVKVNKVIKHEAQRSGFLGMRLCSVNITSWRNSDLNLLAAVHLAKEALVPF